MFVQNRSDGAPRIVTSASDLTAASKCEFAFLRRVDAKLGRDVEVPADDDPMLARAARLGDAHEDEVLQRYREKTEVVEIPRPASMSEAGLAEVAEQTRKALMDGADGGGADVVFQATFWDPEQRAGTEALGEPTIAFVGFADFLRRMPDGAYEVQDAKLARRARVTALMQLAAYAEQLERIGVPAAPEAVLILGDGTRSVHKIADIAPVFRTRRARLHRMLLERVAADAPVAWMAPGIACCGRCEVCEPEVERTRDPLLIAGIRRSQRDALVAGGLGTIDAVAAALPAVDRVADGVKPQVLERLAWQAALQLDAVPGEKPPVRVVDPSAFAALPRTNEGDLFFDFEGDPMHLETVRGETEGSGRAIWGLDYLFGVVDARDHFTPIWAHNLAEEREALLRFLSLVAERRRRYPGMRIYHYASYERTHLLSIAARHGVGEAEVDDLLREHVLVDLYPIVRRALRIGTRSYSIKKLEPLYMGDELRDAEGVTSGAESVTEYAEASALLASTDPAQRAEGQWRLDAIADYNRYDCVSTRHLRDWLLGIAAEHRGEWSAAAPAPPVGDEPDEGLRFTNSAVATALQMHAALAGTERERQVIAMAASAIDYHEREHKSFWWAHFARLVDPIEDWAETKDVMVVDARASAIEVDWFRMPRGRVDRREVRLAGSIAPGSSFRPGAQVFALYEQPAPFYSSGAAPGARAARLVTVIEVHDDGVTIGETLPQDAHGYHVLPVALTPGPPPNAGAQKAAIAEWGEGLIVALDRGALPVDPAMDVLLRAAPRNGGDSEPGEFCGAVADPERLVDAVAESVASLTRGALPVQGPPGTGKTYLAAHVIARLVRERGWRIGVVAQSHKVVENVLAGVLQAGLPIELVGKAPQAERRIAMSPQREARLRPESASDASSAAKPDHPFTPLPRGGHANFLRDRLESGCVIGGTAWDFSNAERVGRRELDLLVIDEAGQFSLAPTIACSVAAERLLLLGDPQQLPQVSQGSHPEPVDTSALGWLLDGRDTMPESLGFFLSETRRMRPELAAVVSDLAYDGRLRAHPSAAAREVHGAGPAGLVWHPVRHAGNSTHSPQEAAEVVRIAREMLAGPLTPRDLIVVAAYNAQVNCVATALAAAGLGEIRVGTVDKFQGQEAVIAIVTLAASSAEDVPRGLEFLLMRNRLNVAISRAQWAAHLVSSDRLGDGLPSSAEGVAALSGYLRLIERASRANAAW